MGTVNKEYASSTFAMYFSIPENLLSLYNAVNGTSYDDTSELVMNTLQSEDGIADSVFSKMANDLSFIFHSNLSLYEHQSTYNPNMPLRMLFYVSQLLKEYITGKDLYRGRVIEIPTPMFVVFYNGRRDIPDKITMKLSEQMAVKVEEPSMELTVTAYNINSGRNIELMESCKPLSQYSEFIFRMRSALAGKKTNSEKSDAIRHVIEECINDNIMSQFLREHREAVMKASLVEYNEQDEREGILLDGIEQGYDKGREEQRKEDEKIIAEMNTTLKQTKTELAETKELVKKLEAQLAALKS